MSSEELKWTAVCKLGDILPGTGVCALVEDRHVAVFRIGDSSVHAIDNIDPRSGASVLSRGLVGNLGEHLVVASPLYKNHFDLRTGACLEAPEHSVRAHRAKLRGDEVWVALA
ncbi:nitrite reductase small subunit NirD [Thauera sp. WH-1]|uniref:nitrite reductase small subunit NirD n=1 Tax=Thauera sp. WH-1 TaxID=3398230 RepID=UPI0039FD0C4C